MIKNIMTVDLEDYFCNLPMTQWENYESRIVKTTMHILDLFEKHKVQATFFTIGKIAESHPELIENIVKRGHEISSHGYSHTDIRKMNRSSFEEDLQKSLAILKKISGENILGFRAPYFSVTKENFWIFDVLKKYLKYDSSIFPVRTPLYGIPDAPRSIYRLSEKNPLENDNTGNFFEIPLATLRLSYFGNLPVAGGFYLRFLPLWIIKTGIKKLNKSRFPAVCFIHPHDLDPEKPRIIGYSWRAYWGLKGATKKFESLLSTFSFSSVREILLH